jgi:hypothetical protein
VVSVGDQSRALQPAARAEPNLCGDFVAEEPDHSGGREQPEVRQGARMNEAFDGLAERDERADEDRKHDSETGEAFAAETTEEGR